MSVSGERIALRVRGRVQGVGYRAFAARLARSLGLAGGARNAGDGSVVVVVAGADAARLAELRRGLERGPAAARVESVETIPADGGPLDFEF